MSKQAIIFDFGWTLFHDQNRYLYSDVEQVIPRLSKENRLALVSLVRHGQMADRRQYWAGSYLAQYFESALFVSPVGKESPGRTKDKAYDQTLQRLKLKPADVWVVDDRVVRGIAWGNRVGATTVWIRRGPFTEEQPTTKTGQPTFAINSLLELLEML